MEELIKILWEASEAKKVCRVSLNREPLPRLIHPYGVAKTSANKIVLVCWQEAGFTKAGGVAGYRNLMLEKVEQVEITDKGFFRHNDFHPEDGQYKDWVYHI